MSIVAALPGRRILPDAFRGPGVFQRALMAASLLASLIFDASAISVLAHVALWAVFVGLCVAQNRTPIVLGVVAVCLGFGMYLVAQTPVNGAGYWAVVVATWAGAWGLVVSVAELRPFGRGARRLARLAAPVIFGLTVVWLWEVVVRGADVPRVILPAPSSIAARFAAETSTLWIDFVQTCLKGALAGFVIGVGAALVFALIVDRSDFLRRGLLPVGNFLAALPIIGTAPIMVMWFGFDWPSKAAVVVAMVFFPMLINTVQGLAASDKMQRDLMHTYSASWGQALLKLRLPAAMPFIFNGLKISSTLALIGAIVAEFFGSPTRGMGFRISTEVGRLQLDMVWAEITVAALAGSMFYGFWALLEGRVTFWHPSQRGR
jgi:NitT/TauT family transport system permease protein